MQAKRNNKDLICENCQQVESTTLLFWEKYHTDTGKTSLINPCLICDKCKQLFENEKDLYVNRPRLVPFDVIANQWDARMQGLTSKSRWHFSCFRNPYFKKKIWRIKFVWRDAEVKRA